MGLYNYQNDLLKEYKGHVNESYQIDVKFIKNIRTGKTMILSGSEDGCLYGWDLNSQRLQIKLPIIPETDFEPQLDSNVYKLTGDEQRKLERKQRSTIFQMDYAPEHETLALCGNFGDIRLINADMESLVE